jgi:S1-C subfamily serine protease
VALVLTLAVVPSRMPVAAPAPSDSGDDASRLIFCPRCGYLADPGWRYCPSCGWDLRTLVGRQARERLEAIGHSVLGLTVAKSNPELSELLSPKLFALTHRYIFYQPGMQKFLATAFPFQQPGIFLTSARALEHGEFADVRTYNNRSFKAEILGYDVASGVGVLRADVPGTAPLTPAETPPVLSSGAWVVCFPVEVSGQVIRYLPQSLHRGSLTALDQTGTGLVSFEDLLRSDHTLPQGCTGGPLVDLHGNAAGLVLGGPDPGLTYSLPLSGLAPIVEALSKKALPERPYFGFGLVTPDDRRRARFGLSGLQTHPLIPYLIPGSPAEEAGILPGDLLLAVDGQAVVGVAEAGGRLLGKTPGGPAVTLTLSRSGKEVEVKVGPARRPDRILLSPSDELQESLEANLKEVFTGATSQQGLLVADLVPGGRGETAGYRNGDIITSVDGKAVRRLENFDQIVRSQESHVFGGKKSEATSSYSTYVLSFEVRAEGDAKERRSYVNLFPDILAPPVY